MKFDSRSLPDPFASLAAANDMSGSFERQRARRARILATARRVLAESQDAFTMRRVADESGVTVQTLRNSFGRREELLVSAINEHTSAVWTALGKVSRGPALFLDLAEIYFHCAETTPAFLRAMVTAAVGSAEPLATLQRHGAAIKIGHLRCMAQEGSLRSDAEIDALAAQITRLNTFMMFEWAARGDAHELRRQMVMGNRLLLGGAVSPSGQRQLDAWRMSEAA